jgi:hypothetical protein
MPKRRTKQQKLKAQQRRPDQIAMLQTQYQFSATKSEAQAKANVATSRPNLFAPKALHATDLFRYDTRLIYRDIIKTLVITLTMILALVIISRFVH